MMNQAQILCATLLGNEFQMLFAALLGGALGGLIMLLALAVVVFIFNIIERKEKK